MSKMNSRLGSVSGRAGSPDASRFAEPRHTAGRSESRLCLRVAFAGGRARNASFLKAKHMLYHPLTNCDPFVTADHLSDIYRSDASLRMAGSSPAMTEEE